MEQLESTLVRETTALLKSRGGRTLRDIAAGAGVSYHWIVKFSQGRFSNPGAVRVEKLRNYLKRIH